MADGYVWLLCGSMGSIRGDGPTQKGGIPPRLVGKSKVDGQKPTKQSFRAVLFWAKGGQV